ncbi:MAG: FAD-dependent oxidoreductase, partial [Rhodococcus sp.]|nr:FAD-dependent oxidoreductase [Rhodococcus sp. (in: high G+C Gram-positive bacteria)]
MHQFGEGFVVEDVPRLLGIRLDSVRRNLAIHGTDGGEVEADRCIVAVPASVISRIEFEPGLPSDIAGALGSISYGHAAKLFVPFGSDPSVVPASATLAVHDRYWAWTATGEGPEVQPVLSAFAGSSAALANLEVASG